jgi:hypothetical protein
MIELYGDERFARSRYTNWQTIKKRAGHETRADKRMGWAEKIGIHGRCVLLLI